MSNPTPSQLEALSVDRSINRVWFFLFVRRGLPLLAFCLALGLALMEPGRRGWWLLFSLLCLAEVWPSFFQGDGYLRNRPAIIKQDGLWVAIFRPIFRFLKLEDAWILSFCAWNNRRVRALFKARPTRRVLVLLPHCIQLSRCKLDILSDPILCRRCGLCPVGDCIEYANERCLELRISNRSHKAYLEVRDFKPDLVIGISCYTRLLKGIVKMPDVPCYAIPVSLPYGMCVDTQMDVSHLKAVLDECACPDCSERVQKWLATSV